MKGVHASKGYGPQHGVLRVGLRRGEEQLHITHHSCFQCLNLPSSLINLTENCSASPEITFGSGEDPKHDQSTTNKLVSLSSTFIQPSYPIIINKTSCSAKLHKKTLKLQTGIKCHMSKKSQCNLMVLFQAIYLYNMVKTTCKKDVELKHNKPYQQGGG